MTEAAASIASMIDTLLNICIRYYVGLFHATLWLLALQWFRAQESLDINHYSASNHSVA